MSRTRALAEFAAAVEPQRINPALREQLKDHLLDTIGVACLGASAPAAVAIAGVVRRWNGAAEAVAIGCGSRLPAPKAAFLGALYGRVFTFDDTYEAGPVHPGSPVVAAALSVAQHVGATGRDLLAGIVAGYELTTRIAAALGPAHYDSGFHATGTCAPFGAAAAAARVMRLDASGIAAALGLAGEAAVGLRQYQEDGSILDSALNAARGAELGVAAAEFAAAGVRGPAKILEGRYGVLPIMAPAGDPAKLTAELGERWECAATTVKPFASCRFTHGPVAALRAAALEADDIETVEIAAFGVSCAVSDRPYPWKPADAILSHQLAAALAASGAALSPADFTDIPPEVEALAAKVAVTHDRELDAAYPESWPHRITVYLKGGREVRLSSERPPDLDRNGVRGKFAMLAGPVLGGGRAEEIAGLVANIESVPDARAFTTLLNGGGR